MEDERDQPEIVKTCNVCARYINQYMTPIVSPKGVAHSGDGGTTDCGRDATGPDWWWPL